jgi:hypothetical protein
MGTFYRSKRELLFVFKVGTAAPHQYNHWGRNSCSAVIPDAHDGSKSLPKSSSTNQAQV